MDCSEAQTLIDRGVVPGSQPPLRAALGFHLSRCEACRSYREKNQVLLEGLLNSEQPDPLPHPAQPAAASAPAHPHAAPRRFDTKRLLWLASILLIIGIPLIGVLWLAGIMLRTERNIQAMIVETPAPQAGGLMIDRSDSDAAAPPSATPALTSTSTAEPAPLASAPLIIGGEAGVTGTVTRVWPQPELLPSVGPASDAANEAVQPARPSLKPPPPGEPVTVLVLGNDRRPGEEDVPRTDVVMLLHVDPAQERIAMLSLLRDLWIDIPGYGASRINSAYRLGELYGGPGMGLQTARETVGNLLDISIDHVVMVDFEGFIGLIDALGGVTVDVEKELYDEQFPTMDYGYQVAHFLPGPEKMDGNRALMYSRIRNPDSDFMRIRRQQTVVRAIGERLRERGDLQNILAADQITAALVGYVQTDMPQERILGLIWAFRNYDSSKVERYPMTRDMVSMGVGSDQYALLPNSGIPELLRQQLLGSTP
jgi:LCP family protein required for cell wall assembly